MVHWLNEKDCDLCYWPFNVGPKPGTKDDVETYGLLTADWRPNWPDERLRVLRKLRPVAELEEEAAELMTRRLPR